MAGPVDNDFLIQAATYLGATAIAVPVFKHLKLGTILGFLAAGIALGDHGLGLLHGQEGVFQVAELGVVLFLFIIGLELSLSRLWDLRKDIFGLGLLQMCITGGVFGLALDYLTPLSTPAAWIAGFAFACSSTAFALSLMEERNELNTGYGTKAFSILLFQDLAVIPLLAAIPFAVPSTGLNEASIDVGAIVRATAVILALIVVSRFVLNRAFSIVAVSGSREAFTAMALFVVAGTALAVSGVGLSMALGAFIAGVMLAESSFRHQIETDLEPFRELLLGLFFIGVGMQLDLPVIFENLALVIGGALVLIFLKGGIIFMLARMFRTRMGDAMKAGAILSQGGEFAFVVFSLGSAQGLFGSGQSTIMSAIVTLSMMLTPVILLTVNRLAKTPAEAVAAAAEELQDIEGDVLVVGFGRMGQIVSQVLHSSGIRITTIDYDPKRIQTARDFGNKVYYGDGYNIALLEAAGVKHTDAIVFAVHDHGRLRPTVEELRRICPKLKIIVRAHDRVHEMQLMDAEIDHIIRETLESSLMMAGKTLASVGKTDRFIEDVKQEFRLRDRERLLEQKAGDMHSGKDRMSEPFDVTRRDDQ